MSVKVDLDELAGAAAERRFAYLLTVTDDQRPHAVAVTFACVRRPSEGGSTLIADGWCAVAEDGDLATFLASGAVLHRPADRAGPAAGGTGCGNDCVPVGGP